ncbi:MAG: hypothetical protein AAFQ90_03990 [Pseudomonadota bacterium]
MFHHFELKPDKTFIVERAALLAQEAGGQRMLMQKGVVSGMA